MALLIAAHYPWIKALHVISVIVWMGAQFVLPALLTAHRGLATAAPRAQELLRIESWLVGRIMNPAMLAAFLFGGAMLSLHLGPDWEMADWLAAKLALVFVLAALHGRLLRQFWRARDGREQWEAKQYRLAQGADLALLAGVVVLVVAKPF